MGCFGGAGDRYVQQAESMFEPIIAAKGTVPRYASEPNEVSPVAPKPKGVQDVPTLHSIIDRQQATLNEIEKYCQQVIRCLSIPGYEAPRAGDFSREILGMIRSWEGG